MTYNDNLLNNFLTRVKSHRTDNLIYQTSFDLYILFDRYCITKQRSHSLVTRTSDDLKIKFSSAKVATAWCILDKYNKIYESQRIIDLDNKIQSLYWEKVNLTKLQKRFSAEQQEIYRDKLLATVSRQKQFQYELDKYIIMARHCQLRGFENELTRTSNK